MLRGWKKKKRLPSEIVHFALPIDALAVGEIGSIKCITSLLTVTYSAIVGIQKVCEMLIGEIVASDQVL